jgi:hypothetical protein
MSEQPFNASQLTARQRHEVLDYLMAAWALRQPAGKVFSNSTITELMTWSWREVQKEKANQLNDGTDS